VETFSRLYPFYADGDPVETDLFGHDTRQNQWRVVTAPHWGLTRARLEI
jgi:hypothetical protein